MALRALLRDKHRASDTVDHVRLVVSIVVTLTALVLGLAPHQREGLLRHIRRPRARLRRRPSRTRPHLREYSDEAKPIRATLREYVAAAIADSWRDEPPPSGAYPTFEDAPGGVERRELEALLVKMDMAIHRLDPPDGFHQRLTNCS